MCITQPSCLPEGRSRRLHTHTLCLVQQKKKQLCCASGLTSSFSSKGGRRPNNTQVFLPAAPGVLCCGSQRVVCGCSTCVRTTLIARARGTLSLSRLLSTEAVARERDTRTRIFGVEITASPPPCSWRGKCEARTHTVKIMLFLGRFHVFWRRGGDGLLRSQGN